MKLKLDLHVHTTRSSDAHTSPKDLVPIIRGAGLDGLAITDHNILATEGPEGALIIPGIEISSQQGHIIALGISEPIPRGLPANETITRIKLLRGVSIIAHPYDFFRSAVNPDKMHVLPDAVEVINSASMFHSITWKRAKAFAKKHRLPETGGSDSHIPQTIGKAFTVVETASSTVESVLDAIRTGLTVPEGQPYQLRDRLRKIAWRI